MKRLFTLLPILGMSMLAFGESSGNDISQDDNGDVVIPEDSVAVVTDYELAITDAGGISNDLSESKKIKLAEPVYGYVNFSGFEKMPTTKQADLEGWMEFFDGDGNYFKKRVIVNAQGSSSLGFPKKNIGIDICEDEWVGDATTDVTFGDWVKQDSFHLKAYYTDYFRGVAVAAYRLFDDIIADHGDMAHPWQRAGVADADDKARCHPDGFPVGVYLNGEFYGVFSWQLKKHRKNMGMTKDLAEHIHLDGTFSDEIFKGNIDWTLFEIRNPKTLYCMDGSKYDGDKPQEIIDETSEFFDASNKGHVLSAKVKQHIVRMTTRVPVLLQYRQEGRSEEEIREELSRYFDVQGLIDYTVFSSVTNNVDGWVKNWQWTTYDGEKWYVNPYDLDMTFGNIYNGYSLSDPLVNWFYDKPNTRFAFNNGPSTYINIYFAKDLDKRYAELRKSGVIDADAIMAKIRSWHDRVGEANYALEYEKWPESYCVQDMVIDDNWTLCDDYTGFLSLQVWNDSVTYLPGDICKVNNMVWIANNEVTGVNPCPNPGYRDSLERVEDWIVRRIAMEDELWNYNPTGVDSILTEEESDGEIETIYNVNGQVIPQLQKGVNIVRYSSGKVAKVMVR